MASNPRLENSVRLVESSGYDSAYILVPKDMIVASGCILKPAHEKGMVWINGEILAEEWVKQNCFKLHLHLARMVNGVNLPLINTSEVKPAIEAFNSILGFDISECRLIGIAFAVDFNLHQIVRNYFSVIQPKYGRKVFTRFPHAVYVNSPNNGHDVIERIFYDKGCDVNGQDSTLLRCELRILKNLISTLAVGTVFKMLRLSDLSDTRLFLAIGEKWKREFSTCLKQSIFQSMGSIKSEKSTS